MLVRLFRGVIREGAHDRLLRELHDHVLPRLEAHPGVVSATLAFPLEADPGNEYLLESRWRDVEDVVRFLGDDWRSPSVEPHEEEVLVSVSAHHYVTSDDDGPMHADIGQIPPMVRLGDVAIDGFRLQVTWNGSAIHLPPREMSAMLSLASDVGAPVPSSHLARRIWPGSALVGPYDVRRVIHRLRAILRYGGVPLEVRNLHGLGYGLEPIDPP